MKNRSEHAMPEKAGSSRIFFYRRPFGYALLILILVAHLGGCAGVHGNPPGGPDPEGLSPGLRVLYFYGKYRSVHELPDGDAALLEKGRPGEPIPVIDHQFGQDEVFGSGRNLGVGVQMKGYILLEKPGRYEFQALSNDGVEVKIDGQKVVSDPGVHSDRLSDIGGVTVEKPGWHPLMVKYFQRKGTAALKFYWKAPGKDGFEVVPAKAYGHMANN
ncbi:PA14 domain-containing protein [Desulfococcus sp.]|uniref:PA14 domain-containing protein n=1 Tax=Desulfococcus sp. TaxID=2025834 RepID=UPI0035931597